MEGWNRGDIPPVLSIGHLVNSLYYICLPVPVVVEKKTDWVV